MADINLSEFAGDEIVFHFGGRPSEVDAYTFANTLLAFSEALQEISRQLDPNTRIEITIEGLGEGSFRAKLRTVTKLLSRLLQSTAAQEAARNIILPLLMMFIYDRYFADRARIIVTDDSYIYEHGHDRIIMPKFIYDKKKSMRDPAAVDKQIARGFSVLEDDPSVTDFGITKKLDDPEPTSSILRQDFGVLSRYTILVEEGEDQRVLEQREKLVVVRAILMRGTRRWQFVWNGIQISAPILDERFYDALARREYTFGQGDIIDVTLRIFQERDTRLGVYINKAYEVTEVFGKITGPRQESFLSR
jgi:hypothetical protein